MAYADEARVGNRVVRDELPRGMFTFGGLEIFTLRGCSCLLARAICPPISSYRFHVRLERFGGGRKKNNAIKQFENKNLIGGVIRAKARSPPPSPSDPKAEFRPNGQYIRRHCTFAKDFIVPFCELPGERLKLGSCSAPGRISAYLQIEIKFYC